MLQIGPGGVLTNQDEVAAQLAGTPSVVVVLNIFNSTQTPVTLDAVHSLTSFVGPVTRILLFDKDSRTNAMVEFGNLETAIKAQKMLHRHHLWNNQTGLILTTFSKQSTLNIAGYLAANPSNYLRARDYTVQGGGSVQVNPNLPTGTITGNTPYAMAQQQQQQQQQGSFGAQSSGSTYTVQSGGFAPQPVTSPATPYNVQASSAAYGGQPSSTSYTSGYGIKTNYGAPSYLLVFKTMAHPSLLLDPGGYAAQASTQYGTGASYVTPGSYSSSGQQGAGRQPPPPPPPAAAQSQYGLATPSYGQVVWLLLPCLYSELIAREGHLRAYFLLQRAVWWRRRRRGCPLQPGGGQQWRHAVCSRLAAKHLADGGHGGRS